MLFNYLYILNVFEYIKTFIWGLGIGDWGLGIGDWGLGPIPTPQSPIPIQIPNHYLKIIN